MAGWSTVTGAVVGIGVGEAAGIALEPAFEPQRQDAWQRSKARIFELEQLALLGAAGLASVDSVVAEGGRNGFDESRVRRAIQLALTAPPIAEALTLWRRGKIDETLVDHALAKERLEPQYWPAVKELFYSRLDPAVIATAIQRGIMKDPGFLPVGPPTSEGKVKAFPVSPLDPVAEARSAGIDIARLFVETAIVGLPLSLEQAASAYFRGIIERVDFDRAVAEGNTRNEWGEAALEQARRILTPHDGAELQLRGFASSAERDAIAAKVGMSPADAERIYNLLGRSLAIHAITTGLARGGQWTGGPTSAPEPYLSAIQRSNVRPEYYSLDYANRYSYPSAFFFRILLESNAITAAEGEQRFLELGWPPDLAKLVADRLASSGGSAGKEETKAELRDEFEGGYITETEFRAQLTTLGFTGQAQDLEVHLGDARRIKRYREKAVDAIAAAYSNFKIDDTTAIAELAALNVLGEAATMLIAVWQLQRLDRITLLTAPQVKKAYTRGLIARDQALAELEHRGYTPTDAAELLDE